MPLSSSDRIVPHLSAVAATPLAFLGRPRVPAPGALRGDGAPLLAPRPAAVLLTGVARRRGDVVLRVTKSVILLCAAAVFVFVGEPRFSSFVIAAGRPLASQSERGVTRRPTRGVSGVSSVCAHYNFIRLITPLSNPM